MESYEILTAMFMIAMLFFLVPRAKIMLKNSPKGDSQDWMGFIIPIVAIIGFVALLIAII